MKSLRKSKISRKTIRKTSRKTSRKTMKSNKMSMMGGRQNIYTKLNQKNATSNKLKIANKNTPATVISQQQLHRETGRPQQPLPRGTGRPQQPLPVSKGSPQQPLPKGRPLPSGDEYEQPQNNKDMDNPVKPINQSYTEPKSESKPKTKVWGLRESVPANGGTNLI